LAYWESIKQSMLGAAQAAPAPSQQKKEEPKPSGNDGFEYKEESSGIVITAYEGNANEISIPAEIDGKPVTGIGSRAFAGKEITAVTIPGSVTAIARNAFERNQISELSIGGGVENIGDRAFQANKLTQVIIPASVKSVGSGAFDDNPLTFAVIPDGEIKVDSSAFGSSPHKRPVIRKASDHALASGGEQYTPSEDFKWETTRDGKPAKDGKEVRISGYKGSATEIKTPPAIQGLPVTLVREIRNKNVTSLIIPDSVLTIGRNAFNQCPKRRSPYFKTGV
jgi:hypothetical protein